MAGTLGGLVVTLGLDAAEFTAGITKTEYEAKKMAQKLDRAIADGARAAATAVAGIGLAAAGAFVAIQKLADEAGNFQDIAEKTGANAEALASFKVSADVAGASIDTVASAMNKLTKGLVTAEDETKDAGAALAALGLPIKEFKQLDPATQMVEVAKALAQFEDGAGKTAVAMALFGKSGAELLPFLKELAAEGGRQVILTAEQIKRADEYSDAQKRTRAQLQLYLQALATEALPTITTAVELLKELAKSFFNVREESGKLDFSQARSVFDGIALSITKVIDVGDAVVRLFKILGLSIGGTLGAAMSALEGNFAGARDAAKRLGEDIDRELMRPTLTALMQDAQAARRAQEKLRAQEDRGFTPPGRRLNFAGKEDKGSKEKLSDAAKLLETLEREIEKTYELTRVQEVERELAKAGFTGLTAARREEIVALAQYIDFIKAAKKAKEDERKVQEEAARSREQQSRALRKEVDDEYRQVESLRQGNQAMEDNIVALTNGEEALRKLNLARLDALILQKKEEAFALSNVEGTEAWVEAINAHIRALEQRKQLLLDTTLAEQIRIDKEKMQDLKNTFSDAMVQPLVDFVNQTKSAKDAFKDFANTVQQILLQKAARGVTDWIFGGNTQSGFDLSTFFKWLGGMAGGMFGGGSTSFLPGIDTVPPTFGSFASGTAYAPGGMAWVGETGPELVSLPAGARVTPASQARGRAGGPLVFNVNVMPGADTRSAKQVGGVLRDTVIRAIKDR